MDSSGPYSQQNTVVACFRCNTLKRDATADELAALAENVRRVAVDLTP